MAQLVEAVGEAAEEPFEGVGELEVGLGVVELGVERVELGAQGALALAQRRHPGAQLVEREELFLVGLDQARDRAASAGEVALERFAAPRGGVLGSQGGQAAVDLRADELRGLSSSRRTSSQTSPSSSSARIGRLWQTRPPTWR